MRPLKVLVTGGRGFIGRAVVNALRQRGDEVYDAPVDLLDRAAASELLKSTRASHLVHLAWVTTHGEYWTSPLNQQWIAASEALFRDFAEAGGEKIFSMGTCAEYDWLATGGICDEARTPIAPASPYGRAKAELHERLAAMQIPYVWGRLFFPYGPHEGTRRLIPTLIRALLQNEEAVVRNPRISRDFVHVDDVASAISTFLRDDTTGAVNLGAAKGETIGDVAMTIADILQRRELVRCESGDSSEAPVVVAATPRIDCRIGLQTGLRRTIEWWERNP